ncbi:MAG: hypothetical protein HUK05_00165, partial [Prevotella sp.]|nr:hypothetical protein [Prevotella sp.]
MKKNTRTIIDAAWFVFCFLLIQLMVGIAASLICKDYQANSLALGLSFLISSVITIAIYWAARYWTESKEAIKNIPKKLYLRLFIIALASFIPSAWLLEITGVEVNEQQERILMEICNSPFGFIVIA